MKKITFEEIYREKKDYFGKNPHKLTTKIINYKKNRRSFRHWVWRRWRCYFLG